MGQLLLRRLTVTVPVLILVSVAVFLLTFLVPGDPAFTVAGESATPEQIEQTRERLGLNLPPVEQYLSWLTNALSGDLGSSLFSSQSVSETIVDRLPVTLSLAVGAIAFAIVIGVPIGIVAAVKRGRLLDRSLTFGASLGVAIPNYFLGLMLVLVFSLELGWLPATSFVPLEQDPIGWFTHLILPWATLGSSTAAVISRQLRSSLSDVLTKDYIRMARAKGLRGKKIVLKHGLKNALIPVVTIIGTQTAFLLGGTVLVEQIFGLPGIGSLAYAAVTARDIPMIQGTVLVGALMVVAVNFCVDISYGWLNPRVRSS